MTDAIIQTSGIHHVRLTVTDIERSKAFYQALFGSEPAIDNSDQAGDPEARASQEKLYAGCIFDLGGQLLGLRPVAPQGDAFESTRVGLDHVSFTVASVDDLRAATDRLDAAGIEHGELTDLGSMTILSIQDPDDINLELTVLS